MNQSKTLAIIAQLLPYAADLQNGTVNLTVRLLDSRIVEVNYYTSGIKQEMKMKIFQKHVNLQETRISAVQ